MKIQVSLDPACLAMCDQCNLHECRKDIDLISRVTKIARPYTVYIRVHAVKWQCSDTS